MRFCLLVLTFMCLSFTFAQAQKFGYMDSDFILNKMPEYSKAQAEIEQLSAAWQKEIEEMQKKVESAYMSYQSEQVLLTEEMKQERLTEIKKKEVELKDYQKKSIWIWGPIFFEKTRID